MIIKIICQNCGTELDLSEPAYFGLLTDHILDAHPDNQHLSLRFVSGDAEAVLQVIPAVTTSVDMDTPVLSATTMRV